jgi:hypothetical protein
LHWRVDTLFPAESQAENRTHLWPVASNGIRNRRDPSGGWSIAEMMV